MSSRWKNSTTCPRLKRAPTQTLRGGDVGSGFTSQSQLSHRLTFSVPTPPCAIACINICTQVKDPVVHVRIWWILATHKYPACTRVTNLWTWWSWSFNWMNKKKMPETTVIENGVYKLLLNLKPRKAALCCLLQVVTRELAPALTLLLNSSIATD